MLHKSINWSNQFGYCIVESIEKAHHQQQQPKICSCQWTNFKCAIDFDWIFTWRFCESKLESRTKYAHKNQNSDTLSNFCGLFLSSCLFKLLFMVLLFVYRHIIQIICLHQLVQFQQKNWISFLETKRNNTKHCFLFFFFLCSLKSLRFMSHCTKFNSNKTRMLFDYFFSFVFCPK